MKDEDKTKEQLINELVKMRQRMAELEKTETCAGGGIQPVDGKERDRKEDVFRII